MNGWRAAVTASLIAYANAVPSVNVQLRTSFGAPPYLVELLETAAEENATSYFPILDRIADGYFDSFQTDHQLYDHFRDLLERDGHLNKEGLSTFNYALSLHTAAPRIEAHYQFYNNSVLPTLKSKADDGCDSWVYVPFSGQRYCSPELDGSEAEPIGKAGDVARELPFDRVLGGSQNEKSSVVYADIGSESFRNFHKTLSKTAREGKTSYRIRYKPALNAQSKPLTVSGYGVELALKRTDYIVIDDRQAEAEQGEGAAKPTEVTLSEEEITDLRPLSSSELRRLGPKAASFVLDSDSPLDTLTKLTQDFPKHSSSIAATNESQEFLQEHMANRDILLPSGFSVMWINGVQIMPRDVEAYSLLEHLRHERKMINGVRELGLTGPQAVDLLSHEAITASQADSEGPRYDWRDEIEGGGVIIWLNDIEKDKRYAGWPHTVTALLQRVFPGQLPSVRKDIHNLIVPIDFADFSDVTLLTGQLRSFVTRQIPIRFGLVPRIDSTLSEQQAKAVYHLIDSYGLVTALDYLETSLEAAGRKYGAPNEKLFLAAVEDRRLRSGKAPATLAEALANDDSSARMQGAKAYLARLAGLDTSPPVFINGIAIPKTEEWLQLMSQRVGMDLRTIQQAIYEGALSDKDYIPDTFLQKASPRRNPLIIPEDDKEIRHVSLGDLPQFANVPSLPANKDTIEREFVHMTVVADMDSLEGFEQLMEALLFQREHDNVEIAYLHVPQPGSTKLHLESNHDISSVEGFLTSLLATYDKMGSDAHENDGVSPIVIESRRRIYGLMFAAASMDTTSEADTKQQAEWSPFSPIVVAAGVKPGEKALIVNGRVVGPMSNDILVEGSDLEALITYERKKRLLPAALAIEAGGLGNKAKDPLSFSRISNLIAQSLVSDVPEGIFESAPTMRTDAFKQWNSSHTAIKVGNLETSAIQIYVSLDPTSELAQRWVPLIKVLSELDGVYTCLFLNPKERLEEIPIKRFFRQVLSSKPDFDSTGSLQPHTAQFSGLPADALLNMGLTIPPAWLVAPKETVYDLDNIKLSAVKSGHDIKAIYELEHILIEGHSRDTESGPPPRGVQLVLGTDSDAHFADTTIMANLGYFQFKANPGLYNLALQKGRSEEIFNIDSAGSLGYDAQPGDDTTEIALVSFRGATIYPRISHKPGMEEEDVLEPSKSALESIVQGADSLLGQLGLKNPQAGKYFHKAAKLGSGLLSGGSKTDLSAGRHADINIFSVASGHLYERMLNIMMVSVMKHTKHSVKFWFIEQFLSPSFKDFLPVMAEEYGFQYEMVTYKWPHWLRGQKEKQREIWGYKILFLDVLFPLDLDKVIFVDADQIVRTDMYELVQHDLQGAPYGFTPMCDSRTEMEGFRFWKQGYWKNFLKGLPYHISALYVVDLKKFRQMAAGDRLRQNYHQLSADPNSLSNLDQDLPNHMQSLLPIHSLPQEWLWCETWCSDESLKDAKTIDLCNNPQTKEPKLDRARRQVPEWTAYDDEIAAVAKKHQEALAEEGTGMPDAHSGEEESMQERLQREDAERERSKKDRVRDEL